MSFWLLPAKYANGEYSSYRVLVNDTEVGNVVTSKGNWQNASLVGNHGVSLQKGENTISIAASLPEIAEVQSVRLSKQKANAVMDSQMYDNYLRKAQNANNSNVPHTDITGYLPTSDINYSPVFPLHEKNIPLKYSVYKGFSFMKDQEVIITTTSKHKHIIDLFIANGHGVKQEFMSWLAVSEIPKGYSPSDSIYIGLLKVTIPFTGNFIVKVRTYDSGVLGTVDLSINGNYYYDNEPIYHAFRSFPSIADFTYYLLVTTYEDQFGADFPIIYLSSATVPGKVSGYSSTDPTDEIINRYKNENNEPLVGPTDAYMPPEIYYMPTSGAHVAMAFSFVPESTCGFIVDHATASTSLANTRSIFNREIGKKHETTTVKSSIADNDNPNIRVIDRQIQATTAEGFPLEIEIYSISGKRIDTTSVLPKGIYIVKSAGIQQKVVIK